MAENARFDLIVLDPPKFARSGNAIEEAMRGYRRLQTQALRLLDADGILAVCCCSGLITQEMLFQLLAQTRRPSITAASRFLKSRGPSLDHPMAANCLETDYLEVHPGPRSVRGPLSHSSPHLYCPSPHARYSEHAG